MGNKEYFGRALLLNGSPHKEGTTFAALSELCSALEAEGIEAKIIHAATGHRGCTACGGCKRLGHCVIDDGVNEIAKEFEAADALILASPVYYASPNGDFLALLDRLFHSSPIDKRMKVGASVVVARRGGLSASFDALNKYFTISGMPIASSNYWNQVHGASAEDAAADTEGMQTMRMLGVNIAFLVKAIKLAKETYGMPEGEKKIYTNFIRK